jgi:uncharacterized protein (UPF0371 family)
MATCLSQLYHENKRGISAGYAKFETFPVWNLPLNHPVNIAYEAATADLNDVNMIDPFHLDAYGKTTVNYNRDVEIYPVLKAMFEKIYGTCHYKSPTDMGVNMVGNCISNDTICREAGKAEIIRRYYTELCSIKKGTGSRDALYKIQLLMKQAGIAPEDRQVAVFACKVEQETHAPAVAVALDNGTIIDGKTSDLLGPSAAVILNTLKELAGIPHETMLISPEALQPITQLKKNYLGSKNPRLHSDEVLTALSISANTDANAKAALEQLPNLRGLDVHSSVMLSPVDEKIFRKLGMYLTCEPKTQVL